MRRRKSGGFKLREVKVTERGVTYTTFRISGWLGGMRVRKQFQSRDEAIGEKNLLEVQAANTGEITARPTRLSAQQLAEAETAFARLGTRSLSLAVEWFLDTYRPPVNEKLLADVDEAGQLKTGAISQFRSDRATHVRPITLRDYTLTLGDFLATVKAKHVHEVQTAAITEFLTARNVGKKRWNNLRGDLNAFFEWCKAPPRQWTQENPVAAVPKFVLARGVPEILTAERAAELMAHVEKFEEGNLVPYFALALFAGLRPSIDEGEIFKISRLQDPAKVIDLDLGVIRLTPEISKTKHVRQVKIRPNLNQWLLSYPLADYPLRASGMNLLVAEVRKKFALPDDVLRHTFISMHVAKWKSLGEAALEAGNSEAMIKKHYLNLVGETDAATFWAIVPRGLA